VHIDVSRGVKLAIRSKTSKSATAQGKRIPPRLHDGDRDFHGRLLDASRAEAKSLEQRLRELCTSA